MSQNYYEMMYILRPDLSEEQVNGTVNKYRDLLAELGGEGINIQTRGKRRLAYPIKKNFDGIYVQMNYNAPGDHVARIERDMRLSDEVIRYMTLKLDEKTENAAKTESQVEQIEKPAKTESQVEKIEKPAKTEPQVETEAEAETESVDEATPETVEA